MWGKVFKSFPYYYIIMNLLEAKQGEYKIKKVYDSKVLNNMLIVRGFLNGTPIRKLEDGLIRLKGSTWGIGKGQLEKIEVEKDESCDNEEHRSWS